ncbi:hypothetical protein [Rhodoflexus sp.]
MLLFGQPRLTHHAIHHGLITSEVATGGIHYSVVALAEVVPSSGIRT